MAEKERWEATSKTKMTRAASRKYARVMERNFSWPAVSQTMRWAECGPREKRRKTLSMPTVGTVAPSTTGRPSRRRSRELLPTPLAPSMTHLACTRSGEPPSTSPLTWRCAAPALCSTGSCTPCNAPVSSRSRPVGALGEAICSAAGASTGRSEPSTSAGASHPVGDARGACLRLFTSGEPGGPCTALDGSPKRTPLAESVEISRSRRGTNAWPVGSKYTVSPPRSWSTDDTGMPLPKYSTAVPSAGLPSAWDARAMQSSTLASGGSTTLDASPARRPLSATGTRMCCRDVIAGVRVCAQLGELSRPLGLLCTAARHPAPTRGRGERRSPGRRPWAPAPWRGDGAVPQPRPPRRPARRGRTSPHRPRRRGCR